MSTQFNFPANPNVGDTFTLPNGSIAQWNGTEWVSVDNSNVTYPLAITLGGTAATTAGNARINLGLNAATGEFIVQKDGTVTNPGIAFASEPGLGFYRSATNVLRIACAGVNVWTWGFDNANNTYLGMSPRVAGISMINMGNRPVGTANNNSLNIVQNADGSASIQTVAAGTATRGNLTLDAPNVTSTCANFLVGPTLNNMGFYSAGASFPGVRFTSDNWRFEYNSGANVLSWVAFNNTVLFNFMPDGSAQKSSGAGQWNGISDIRLKENIAPLGYGLDEILRLEPITYDMIDGATGLVGLSAQASEPVMPSMVYKSPHETLGEVYGLKPDFVQYALVNAIKTLNQRLAALEHPA